VKNFFFLDSKTVGPTQTREEEEEEVTRPEFRHKSFMSLPLATSSSGIISSGVAALVSPKESQKRTDKRKESDDGDSGGGSSRSEDKSPFKPPHGETAADTSIVCGNASWISGMCAIVQVCSANSGSALVSASIDIIGKYLVTRKHTLQVLGLMGPVGSMVVSDNECVGEIFVRFVRDVDPKQGALHSLLPLDRLLPHLHREIGNLTEPLPSPIIASSWMNPRPSWQSVGFACAAYKANVAWPPWHNPSYHMRTCSLTRSQLSEFTCDPYNGEILGSWNGFGAGRTDVSGAANNDLQNLLGIIAPKDPFLATLWATRPPETKVLWFNRHGYLAASPASFTPTDPVRHERHRIASLPVLSIYDSNNDHVDNTYAAIYVTS
jgi:hypothetical protein